MADRDISPALAIEIFQALADDYVEGAIEAVFKYFPDSTRDEAVDIVDRLEAAMKSVRVSGWINHPLQDADARKDEDARREEKP